VGDRLGGAGRQELRPHFSEQRVRGIDIATVDLAVHGEDVADDVRLLLSGRTQLVDIGLLCLLELLVLERGLQAVRGRRRSAAGAVEAVPELSVDTGDEVPDPGLALLR